jgi:hypothetical protein
MGYAWPAGADSDRIWGGMLPHRHIVLPSGNVRAARGLVLSAARSEKRFAYPAV